MRRATARRALGLYDESLKDVEAANEIAQEDGECKSASVERCGLIFSEVILMLGVVALGDNQLLKEAAQMADSIRMEAEGMHANLEAFT